MEKVLITGISGGLGRLLTRRLRERWQVCGVDRDPWLGSPPGVQVHLADLRKRRFEDIVRTERPDAVVHLGFIRHFRTSERLRHDVNVRGTKFLLDHCIRYGVDRLVVLSSGYVYGAFAENPYLLDEDAPLSASRSYPEIRDLIEVDTLASTFLWRHPEVATSVLRPVNVLGPHVQSTARAYLTQPRVPTVMGFNPMMPFLHEEDLCAAIEKVLGGRLRGVFNVVGPGEVPVHTAIRETGGVAWPLPDPPVKWVFDRLFSWGLSPYPAGLLDFLKFPVSLSGRRFAEATDFRCAYGLTEIFESVRS